MGFDPCNVSFKIRESIKISIPKVGAHFGVWVFILSHSPTLPGVYDVLLELPSYLAFPQTFTLVTSPRLGLWHLSICTIILEATNVFKARHIKRGNNHRKMPCSYAPLSCTITSYNLCYVALCVCKTPMQFCFSDQFCFFQGQYNNYIWSLVACTIPNILPSKKE
jgi:hypothetical protein